MEERFKELVDFLSVEYLNGQPTKEKLLNLLRNNNRYVQAKIKFKTKKERTEKIKSLKQPVPDQIAECEENSESSQSSSNSAKVDSSEGIKPDFAPSDEFKSVMSYYNVSDGSSSYKSEARSVQSMPVMEDLDFEYIMFKL
jgi:hypothetical protein